MTREEFIKILDKRGYTYEIEGDKLVFTHRGYVDFDDLESIPSGVEFRNKGYIRLGGCHTIPPDTVFSNEGSVSLDALKILPPTVEFKNSHAVRLDSLGSIPPGFVFKNGGDVSLWALKSIPPGVQFNYTENSTVSVNLHSIMECNWYYSWKGNIEGIASNRLLNLMISKGVFI